MINTLFLHIAYDRVLVDGKICRFGLKQVNLVSAGLPFGSKRLFSLPGLFHIDPAFLSPGLSMFEHFFRKGFRALIKLGRSGEQVIMTMFLHFSSFQSKRTASKECLSPYVLR